MASYDHIIDPLQRKVKIHQNCMSSAYMKNWITESNKSGFDLKLRIFENKITTLVIHVSLMHFVFTDLLLDHSTTCVLSQELRIGNELFFHSKEFWVF